MTDIDKDATIAVLRAALERIADHDSADHSQWKIARDALTSTSGAAPAVQAVGEIAEYQMRMCAPNGNAGPWHKTERECYEKFHANSDIGDGYSYETRALIAVQVPPSAEPPHD